MTKGRPKTHDYPPNMTVDKGDGRFSVRNPITGKRKKFSRDKEKDALRVVNALNEWLANERALKALKEGRPTIDGLVVKWIADRVPLMPWAAGTRENYVAKAKRIREELGERTIDHTDCMYIEDWISARTKTADAFNDWLYVFVLLWKFGVSRKLTEVNEPEKIEQRSTSKKLDSNQKQRLPLDVLDYRDIHDKADDWLRLAMDVSLVTLQGRAEVCAMQMTHFRDGFLYVVRAKTSGDSDMAFIRIELTPQLLEFQSRSRQLDDTVSPYLIHRRPDSMRRTHIDPKDHWTQVTPDYLSKAFAEARDKVPRFAALLPARKRPTFHEIRGLGARLCEASGMSPQMIQWLMTHSDKKVTNIYLEGGLEALKDTDFKPVVAPLKLRDVLK